MGKVVSLTRTKTAKDLPYFLTDSETRRHGVDIGSAVQVGLLTAEDFTALLAACRSCDDGTALRGRPGHDRNAAEAPEWCANRAVLEALRGMV